jgi:hypothetical protein
VVELEDSEEQMQRESGIRLQFFVEGKDDLVFGDTGNLSAVKKASGNDVEDLAGLSAENAGEVSSLIAGQGGGG